MSEVVEFIFFQLKPSVKPEEQGNDEGQEIIQVFQTTKHQSGYHSSAWGRAVEDENIVAWVIGSPIQASISDDQIWTDARGSSLSWRLRPFLEPSSEPTVVFSTLAPSISASDTLTTNPVTEICGLAFPTSFTPDDHISLHQNLLDFRTALTQDLPTYDRPKSWAMGTVERPGALDHGASPSGKAFVHVLVVGWESVEKHKAVKESKKFQEAVQPIRQKLLTPVECFKLKHVVFRKI